MNMAPQHDQCGVHPDQARAGIELYDCLVVIAGAATGVGLGYAASLYRPAAVVWLVVCCLYLGFRIGRRYERRRILTRLDEHDWRVK